MRASVVSRRSRVTRTSSAPRPLMVPANTSSPGALSTGSDSPVTGAWLTALAPATTSPSSGTFSPGLTTMTAPGRDLDRPATVRSPSRRRGPAPRPASDPSARGPRSARARACAPRAPARRRTGRRRPPPRTTRRAAIAPAAATSISTLMSSDRSAHARARPCARSAGRRPRSTAPNSSARHATAAPSELGERARPRARARRDQQRAAPARARRRRSAIGSSCSSQARMPASATAAAIADGRQLRRVVLDVQPLAHQVGGEVLQARQVS